MKDDEIFDYVINENLILVTNDMRFSLKTHLQTIPLDSMIEEQIRHTRLMQKKLRAL